MTIMHRRLSVATLAALFAVYFVSGNALPTPRAISEYSVNQTYRLFTQNTSTIAGPFAVTNGGADAPAGWSVAATVVLNSSYDDLGWDFVHVAASKELLAAADRGYTAYYTAGYLEGYVTSVKIGQVYIGEQIPELTLPQVEWINHHVQYMSQNVMRNMNEGYPSNFWTQVGNLLAQMQGLSDGYMQAMVDKNVVGHVHQPNISFMGIFLLNFNNEIADVQNAVAPQEQLVQLFKPDNILQKRNTNLHCSALVKITDDDVFFSHVTWGGYNTMVRQYKVYEFQETVSLSAVAGTIASGDDWYQTSNHKLFVQETTNDYYNMSLVQLVVPQTVSEFLRVMVANYLADSGKEWIELFSYNNSGTYCNQWMVLDTKLYLPGQKGDALQDNLLWVAEQIPGNVTSADVTHVLRSTSYWASFNIPYFPNIYEISGFQELYEQFGDVFSYTKYARPEIFKRNQTDVKDLMSMRAMMRYNDWQVDPLSEIPNCPGCNPKGSPWLAISSRGDLVNYTSFVLPTNFSYASQFNNSNQGGIDCKIASYSMFQNSNMGNVICGPTYDQQPVFVYDIAYPGQRPPGSANVFDFPWQFFNVPVSSATAAATNDHTRDVVIGLCIGIPLAVVAVVLVVMKYKRSRSEASYNTIYSMEQEAF